MSFEEKKFPRLKDCLPITNGVFGHMSYTFRNEVTKAQLDYLLMADAAQRNPAPVIDLIYDEEEPGHHGQLTDAELNKLAALMLAYYKPRWDKLGDIYDIEYDPIHNYLDEWEDNANGWEHSQLTHDTVRTDRYNDLTVDHTSTHAYDDENPIVTKETDKRNYSTERSYEQYKEKERRDWDETVTRQYDAENPISVEKQGIEKVKSSHENIDAVAGFNTAANSFVNTDKSSGTQANNETETSFVNRKDVTKGKYSDKTTDGENGSLNTKSYEGTYKDTVKDDPTNGSVKETKQTGAESTTGSDTTSGSVTREMDGTETTQSSDNRDRSGSHYGNIGNLTSQKMLNEEIELWKWNYVRSILDDAIKFLTLDVYL